MNENLDFDEWFYIFMDRVNRLNYSGPVDKYTFESDYEEGKSPEVAAKEFVKDMND